MNVSKPAPLLELPIRSTATSTVSALLMVRLRASPLHALPLFLQETEQTTDMSSGLLTTDCCRCALPPAAASPQCCVDDGHDVSANDHQPNRRHRTWVLDAPKYTSLPGFRANISHTHRLPDVELGKRSQSSVKVVRDSFGSSKMCQFFCQNLLFMAQAVRK